jgi:hypothetical protein
VIVRAAIWTRRKIEAARVRHHNREAWRTLCKKSDPTPGRISTS